MLNSVGFFTKIIRPLAADLDKLIYGLVGWVLSGVLELSNLMANETFSQTIYKNLYVLLAVFMVFKLTFSFIQYMVSPDKMLDKDQGVGKLIVNAIVMLVMLILLPIIFFEPLIETDCKEMTLLNATQRGVLNTLPNIILGEGSANVSGADACKNSSTEQVRTQGEDLAINMLSSLVVINDDAKLSEDEAKYRITSFDDFTNKVNQYHGDKYDYDYMFPLTTIAGIVLVVVLLGVAIDVAVRVFKLIILQVIAPIPVMTYIDPKSSKDGAFNSWLKSFISTYLDLFIKIGSIYILLLLIQKLNLFDDSGMFGDSISSIETFKARTFVRVFLVIGLFKFAKDAPKFIKDAMGIKDSGGGGGLFGGLAALGAAAGTVGGAAAGLIGGAAGGIAAGQTTKGKIGGALTGAASGMFRGGSQGFSGAKKGNAIKGMTGAISAQNAVTQRKMAAAAAGSTFMGRMGARADEFLGTTKDFETAAEDAKNLNAAAGNLKTIRDTAKDKGFINRSLAVGRFSYKDSAGRYHWATFASGEHSGFKDAYEFASSHGQNSVTFGGKKYDMVTAGNIYKNLGDAVTDKFLSDYKMGDNAAIDAAFEDYRKNLDQVSKEGLGTISTIADARGASDTYAKDLQKQGATVAHKVDPAEARKYKANKDAIKKGK